MIDASDGVEAPASGPSAPDAGTARRRRRAPELFSWIVLAALVGWSAAWLVAGSAWLLDLLAILTAQAVTACAVAALWWLVRRRWVKAAIAGAGIMVGAASMPHSRAPRDAGASGDALTVLTINALTRNPSPDAVLRLLMDTPADVVTILEAPDALLDAIGASEELSARYVHSRIPRRAGAGFQVALSRWPLTPVALREAAGADRQAGLGRTFRVERPQGAFMLSMLHPRSPRSPALWREGNETIEAAVLDVTQTLAPMGLPIVIGADMNSSASGWRTRTLCARSGLRMCKPVLTPAGTRPAWSVWPLAVAIDDVLVSAGVTVRSWRTLPPTGSDHHPVLVELSLPHP